MTIRPRDRLALAAVAAIALIAAFYLLVLTPVRHHAARVQTALDAQRADLTQAETAYSTGKTARTALNANAASWTALRRAVPKTSDIPALLRVLQRNAAAVGVNLQTVSLSGSSGATSDSTTSAPSTSDGATTVPVSLTFTGTYRALDALVKRLDGLVAISGSRIHASGPLLSISTISLSSDSSKLTFEVTASLYQLAAASSATPTATGGAS